MDGPRVERLHLGVYFDDLSVLYSFDDDHSRYRDFAAKLQERWRVEDEGDCHDLLGVEFEQTDDHLLLHKKPTSRNSRAISSPRAYRPPRRPAVLRVTTLYLNMCATPPYRKSVPVPSTSSFF